MAGADLDCPPTNDIGRARNDHFETVKYQGSEQGEGRVSALIELADKDWIGSLGTRGGRGLNVPHHREQVVSGGQELERL